MLNICMIYMYVGKKNRSIVIFYHRHNLIRKKIYKKSCCTMQNSSQNTSLSRFHLDYFFNILFTNKQILKNIIQISWKKNNEGKISNLYHCEHTMRYNQKRRCYVRFYLPCFTSWSTWLPKCCCSYENALFG